MDWGYYCRTCGESSAKFYPDPQSPMEDAEAAGETVFSMVFRHDSQRPLVRLAVVDFLARHTGHDLWAECPAGVLRLSPGIEPEGRVRPPRFARSLSPSPMR